MRFLLEQFKKEVELKNLHKQHTIQNSTSQLGRLEKSNCF